MANPRKLAMNPDGLPLPHHAYFSQCVKVLPGPLLFVSGQVGRTATGDIPAKGDPGAQARQAFQNISIALQAHGATLDDIVKVTVYVTDITYFDTIAEVRLKLFPGNGPASSLVQVSRLRDPDALVEVEAVAVVP